MIPKSIILVLLITVNSALGKCQAWCDECPKYLLKTSLQNQTDQFDFGTPKDELWLGYYHTSAGQGDVVFESDASHAWVGWFNGTDWIMADPTNDATSLVAGMGVSAADYQSKR
jgi:hypothetical protein